MGIAAYYHSVLPYYYYPAAIGGGLTKDQREAAAGLPSVRKLYAEYHRLRERGFDHSRAIRAIRERSPEMAHLIEGEVRESLYYRVERVYQEAERPMGGLGARLSPAQRIAYTIYSMVHKPRSPEVSDQVLMSRLRSYWDSIPPHFRRDVLGLLGVTRRINRASTFVTHLRRKQWRDLPISRQVPQEPEVEPVVKKRVGQLLGLEK